MAFFYAFLTVAAWGTWLTPSQKVKFSGQQVRVLYVTVVNWLISGVIAATQGLDTITPASFWLPFSGGIVWALGGWAAFAATDRIGLVRAYGVWSPLNILVSIVLGALFFKEFVSLNARAILLLCISLGLIIGGVLLIIRSKESTEEEANRKSLAVGWICAIAAGVLWAAYYIPIRISETSMWVAAFPMGCGMLAGCLAIALLSRKSLRLESRSAYLLTAASGVLWACGNYSMLLLVQAIGTGRGFTIAQLALVVNAISGIYLLKDPPPKSRAARLALTGCVLATVGAITLGKL